MADNNLPEESGPDVANPQTFDEQIEDISNLLGDPETDPTAETEDSEAAEHEAEAVDDDDPLGLDDDAEDVDEDGDEEPDGSGEPEIKGGRFAPDSAKVTLDDGTVITVAELKRNNLFQRGFTEKTTALAEDRKKFEAERQQVTEHAQSLEKFREYASWYAEQFLPKQPEPFNGDPLQDPHGYLDWQHKRDQYLTHVQAYQTFQQQKELQENQKAGETQKQMQERLQSEQELLTKAMPVLKDPARAPVAMEALRTGARDHYGFAMEEVNSIQDHRQILVLRDALAYRRIKAKAPEVQASVAQKPAPRGGRRAPPQSADSKGRQVRSEQLRNSGTFEAGVAALSDFDL